MPEAAGRPAAAAAFNAANAAFRAGRWAEAREGADRAIEAHPDLVQAHVLKARALRALGEEHAAGEAYRAALARDPAQFDALLEYGNVLRALEDADGAAARYAAAMAARPSDPRPALALARLEEERGAALAGAGQVAALERAAVAFQQALDRAGAGPDPDPARAALCVDLAHQRLARADLPRALEALRQAGLWSCPPEATAAADLLRAEILLRLGLTPAAQALMERLSALSDPDLLRQLARLSYRFNFWAEAVAILRRVADLAPDAAQSWLDLAEMLAQSWQIEEALVALDRAEAAGPVPDQATLALRAMLAGRLGDARAQLALYDRLLAEGHDSFAQSAAMSLLYADHLTPEEVAARHRALFAGWGQGARERSSFGADPDPDRPLRVGMVTADLHHQHPVNIFLQPLLARWDHDALPLTVYFTGRTADDQTRLARSRVRRWREVPVSGLPAAVRADDIDILIDLSGHTAGGALRQFAQRMAPVQLGFLGYPGSTGVPNMDWLLGDPVVTPPEADPLCSERVLRLPGTVFCFAPEIDYPLPEFARAAQGRPFTFGSFNNIPKLTQRTVRLWAGVLTAVPEARLLLRAPSFGDGAAVARFRRLFAEAGVDPQRLAFRGPVALDAMMAAYAEVDVALDPLPYCGGTTTLQALWMGVPVLTRQGGHFVSRMGASFLSAAGLPDWVAQSDSAYVARAVAAGRAPEALLTLKQTLRQRLLARPAWNADRYAAEFADGLRTVWRASMESVPQEPLRTSGDERPN